MKKKNLSDILEEYKDESIEKVNFDLKKTDYEIEETANNENYKNNKNIAMVIVSILLGIFIISSLSLGYICYKYYEVINKKNNELNNKKQEIEEKNEKIKNLEKDSKDLKTLIKNTSTFYVRNKLDFFDNHIVFVVSGGGNYYYNYDCLQSKFGATSYSFMAYNSKAAIARGYYKGGC